MQRIPVESSDIVAIGYDPKERVLEIEFQAGRVYQYFEVPQDIYDHFMRADSYGMYFNAHIIKHYRYRRVDEAAPKSHYDTVAFVTGNEQKFHHQAEICAKFDVQIEQLILPIEEIQSTDIEEVVRNKAKRAYALAGRPVLVNDVFWNILALRGFPGAYMKDVIAWFGAEDFLKLMADKQDRTISCTEALMFYDGKRSKLFTSVNWGTITGTPRGKGTSIDQIVIMQGQTETLAELAQKQQLGVDPEAIAGYQFAKWYGMQRKLQSFTRR